MGKYIPAKFKTRCNNPSAYIAKTSANIRRMAEGLMRYLIDKDLDTDVRVYYKQGKTWTCLQSTKYSSDNDAWMKVEHSHGKKSYTWYEHNDLDPNKFFEYNGDYLSMSFEGNLYYDLNYAFESGDYSTEEELNNYFSHWGLYYEMGYAWSLSLYDL